MAVINADGETGPPLFVFKGVRLPYRVVLGAGGEEVQTYATYLPREARVAMREQKGGVDSEKFYRCGLQFVDSVRDLTAGNRKVLLT